MMHKLISSIALVLTLMLSMSSYSLAQQSESGQDVGQSPMDQMLQLLANEIVLAPGVGLPNIRLGENLELVQFQLGPPTVIGKKGAIKRKTTLAYQIDGETNLLLIGKKVVERIAVRGNQTSLVRTVQGARFGMSPANIRNIYRGKAKAKKNRLEFRRLGITFYFNGGKVAQIDVYPRS